MNRESKSSDGAPAEGLLPWDRCNCFCIHEYSGTGTSSCGWRGLIQDARRNGADASPLCPRCGSATLLSLPSRLTDLPEV